MSQGGIISAVIPVSASSGDTSNVLLTNVDCLSSVYAGAVLILNGSGVAENAIADSLANSNMIGICEVKPSLNKCDIRVLGTTGVLYSSLDTTKEYYLSDSSAGAITTTIPSASGSVILKIGQPFSSTRMVVMKGQRTVRI